MKLICPAYFAATSSFWTFLMEQSAACEYAICNPNSGPGATRDLAYASVIANAQARGISILGYVATTYTAKGLAAVLAECKKYTDWYGVDGFFFDEVSSTPDKLPYYAQLYATVKGVVVLNPGVYTHRAYVEVCDILCVEERPVEVTEDRSESLTRWMDGQPPDKFAYFIFNVASAAKMRRVLKKARQRNVGYVYVTNDALDNPWDTLPSYWNDMCRFVLDP